MRALFEAIRECSDSKSWSRGIECGRRCELFEVSRSGELITLQLHEPSSGLGRTVKLWPREEDWHCDCGSEEDPCKHVIAAAIAVKTAIEKGESLSQAKKDGAKILYRFFRKEGALALDRVAVLNGKQQKITGTISTNQKVMGLKLLATKEDLAVDVLLQPCRDGVIPKNIVQSLLTQMTRLEQVLLDEQPLSLSLEPVGFSAVVEDDGPGVRVSGQQDPRITEVFTNGLALCGGVLHPTNQNKLASRELEILASGRYFGLREIEELASEIIPQLQKKLKVEIRSKKVPGAELVEPRIVIESSRLGHELTIFPKIVYGDPALAEVVSNNRLKILKSHGPVRMLAREEELKVKLSSELNLVAGIKTTYAGEEAVHFTQKIQTWSGDVEGEAVADFHCYGDLACRVDLLVDNDSVDFSVDFELDSESSLKDQSSLRADPAAVISAWQAGERLVPLLNGGWARLPKNWLAKHGQALLELVTAKKAEGVLPKCLVPDAVALCEDLRQPVQSPRLVEMQQVLQNLERIPLQKLPLRFQGELRDYQEQGFSWLRFCGSRTLEEGFLPMIWGLVKQCKRLLRLKARLL